jgi:hypothetical protein
MFILAAMLAGCSKHTSTTATDRNQELHEMQQRESEAERKWDETQRQWVIEEMKREAAANAALSPDEAARLQKERETIQRLQNEGKQEKLP